MFVSLLYLILLPLLYFVLQLGKKFAPNAEATFHECLKSAQLLEGAVGDTLHPLP